MAGGSLTISADTYPQLKAVAQRVLCWAAADRGKVTTTTATGAGTTTAIRVPEEVFAGKGALVLKRAGTDLVSGYVAGTHILYNAGNGAAMEQNVNTCPASTNQPTVTTFVTNVGSVPLATTLTYANVALSGTVDILWGDGTSTLGAAESGSSNHTYPLSGFYTITIRDASVLTDLGTLTVHVP
jgi:hypothetical protein